MSIISRHRRQLLAETYAVTNAQREHLRIAMQTDPAMLSNPDLTRLLARDLGFDFPESRPNIFERVAAR